MYYTVIVSYGLNIKKETIQLYNQICIKYYRSETERKYEDSDDFEANLHTTERYSAAK